MDYEFVSGDYKFKYLTSKTCSVGNNSEIFANGAVKGVFFGGTAVIPSKVYDNEHRRYLIVTCLSRFCFNCCINLSVVSLPNSLLSIMRDSLANTSITTLIVPESVTSLEYAAFSGMFKLKEVIFRPGKLRTIRACVFANPSYLTRVVIPPTVSFIDTGIFRYNSQSSVIDFVYCGSHAFDKEDIFLSNGIVRTFVTKNYPSGTKLGDSYPTVLEDDDNTCEPYMFHYIPLMITKQNCRRSVHFDIMIVVLLKE